MLTKENLKEMDKEAIAKIISDLSEKVEEHLRYLQNEQLRIYKDPVSYESAVNDIREELKTIESKITMIRNVKKSLVTHEKADSIKKRIACANHIINTCFYKYWQKVAPFREFKKEIDNFCDNADRSIQETLRSALNLVYEIYESMEATQISVSALCKRARKNIPEDCWYDEARRIKAAMTKSIEQLSNIGILTFDNEYITHTIYEVMIYEFTVMNAKLDRYIRPKELKEKDYRNTRFQIGSR